MAIAIPNKNQITPSDNIVIGFGEVVAVQTKAGKRWALPGRGPNFTKNRELAESVAREIHELIRVNVDKYKRNIF